MCCLNMAGMMRLQWPTSKPRPRLIPVLMELDLIIMLGSGYSGPRQRLMQISIGYVHILLASVSV